MKFLLTLGLGFILGAYVCHHVSNGTPLLPDTSNLLPAGSGTAAQPKGSAGNSGAGTIVHGVANGSQHI